MDFWDLTKLVFRRWYFMVPMLLVSVAAAAYVASTVKPDFVVKANTQLIPPIISEEDAKRGVTNQWLNLGLSSLSEAAILPLSGQSVIEDLERRGLSTNFTATKEQYGSLLTLEVIAESEEQGVATVERIADLYEDRITSLQKQRGVVDKALITTERLDLGDNLSTSTSKLKRALVAILGAGVLLTVAFTIGMDALLRRLARRRLARDEEDGVLAALPTPPTPRNGHTPQGNALVFRPIVAMDEHALRVPELATGPDGRRGTETRRGSATVVTPSLAVEYRSADKQSQDEAKPESRANGADNGDDATSLIDKVDDHLDEPTAAIVPEDATIVLPLSHNRWAARDGSSKRR